MTNEDYEVMRRILEYLQFQKTGLKPSDIPDIQLQKYLIGWCVRIGLTPEFNDVLNRLLAEDIKFKEKSLPKRPSYEKMNKHFTI
jgi:hypothetical protein